VPRFLYRVLSTRIRAGVRAGLLAAAATGGALIGFGVRHDDWAGPFASLGLQVLQGLGIATSRGMLLTIVGLAAHVSWMVVWGIIFVAVARRTKPATTVLLAFVVGTGVALIARFVLPAAFGAVQFAVMPGVQAALCVVLLAAGLVAGRALSRADSTSAQNAA
jgi:hypothetical protein